MEVKHMADEQHINQASMDIDIEEDILGQVGEESQYWHEVPVSKRERQERLGFLRKVYGILSGQLLMNLLVCSLVVHYEALTSLAKECYWAPLVMIVVLFGLKTVLLSVWKNQVPTNYVILAAFTLIESIFLGLIAHLIALWMPVAIAVILCVMVCLTLYTCQNTIDYSSIGAAIFSTLCCVLSAISIQNLFRIPDWETPSAVMVGFVSTVLCLTIIAYTRILMWDLAPQDYIEASVRLSPDVFYFLLFIFNLYMVVHPVEEDWG